MLVLMDKIKDKADELAQARRQLNFLCSGLSGTAATVPKKAKPPLHYYIGSKVLIHNARYDVEKRAVVASIKLPYSENPNNITTKIAGHIVETTVDADWYPDEI